MTVNLDINPAYLLIDYIWEVLAANDPQTWDRDNYGGLVPIVPLAEVPEIEEFSGPHIVYGYAHDATGELPVRRTGSMTLAIYDQSFRRLTRTVNILEEALGRKDETAADVNNYTSKRTAYHGLAFGTIDCGFTDGGTPETTEGGDQSAIVNIRYEFYVERTSIITQV